MITELILPFSLVLPGFWILQLTKIKVDNIIERVLFSYIISLAIMFSLLYSGAILFYFNVTSFIYLIILIISFLYLFASFIYKNSHNSLHKVSIFKSSLEKVIIAISAVVLLLIYVIFLQEKAILDSDVVQYYLPIAREIARENGFTYRTGYDYNIILKPIGASVLYAWTYTVCGSILSEDFRLMPLIPLLMLIILNYIIVTSATKSEKIGVLSTALFLILPFHDRFLLYSSFYPDVFYYPLIFGVIYLFIKYSYSDNNTLLFWIGMSLGCAALLKAQAIYFFITSILIFLILELGIFKKISVILCAIGPFLISIPYILANIIQREGIRIYIPTFTETQIILLSFLSIFCIVCYYLIMFRNAGKTKAGKPLFKDVVRKIFSLLLPFVLLSSLWYIVNLFKFGTLLYTSSINLPNYDWALKVLQSLETAQLSANLWDYIMFFIFMFVDPALIGYIMLIPLLIGLAASLISKNKLEGFSILFLFEIIASSIIFSEVIVTCSEAYNPRDILPLAPLLTSLIAIGIEFTPSIYRKKMCAWNNEAKNMFTSFLLIVYLGFLAYIHSVYVYFISVSYHNKSKIVALMSTLGKIVDLNLMQTSFQLPSSERAFFVGSNFQKILSLSVLVGIPVIILISCRYFVPSRHGFSAKHRYALAISLKVASKKIVLKLPLLTSLKLIEAVLILFLILSTIIIPRMEILTIQGRLQELRENQLKNYYGSLYELFSSTTKFEGGILTFEAPMGLPYYMPNNKIVDLMYPANLALFKDCLLLNDSYEMVKKLKQLGIHYILINPSSTRLKSLDASLNFSLSNVVQNPKLVLLSKSFGSWKLYILVPYNISKD
jgi:hypothetical protein